VAVLHPSGVPISDYLADSVDAFLTSTVGPQEDSEGPNAIDVDSPAVPLGLTFSFPVEQKALDKGFLLTWTKGFSAKNAVNKDVVRLLQDAFDRKHLHVKCVALVNDV
jgi:hexokinase